MYQILPASPEKIEALKRRPDARPAELLLVRWPSGAAYYAAAEFWAWKGYEKLRAKLAPLAYEARIVTADGGANFFAELLVSSDIADEQVAVELWDGDGKVNDLVARHGEGVPVEVLYYFPQEDWLVSEWWGTLEAPDALGELTVKLQATAGFRTPNMRIPKKPLGATGCQSLFGGALPARMLPFNPCRYDRHVGGSFGLLDAESQPFTSCPKTQDGCRARLGDTLSYYGLDAVNESHLVGQSKGSAVLATAKGNETNLADARAWVFGGRYVMRKCPVLKITPETNTKHPDQAALRVLWSVCRGPIGYYGTHRINNITVSPRNINERLGLYRQPPTGFSANILNFSLEAHNYGVVIGGPWTSLTPDQVQVETEVAQGFSEVVVYDAAGNAVRQWSDDRTWVLRTMYEDWVDGLGYDPSRFVNDDWQYLSAWATATVRHKAADGTILTGPRTSFTGALYGRIAQQQIRDVCLFGGFSLPFQFEGRLRVLPLERADLSLAPVFKDYGTDRNILAVADGRSSLGFTRLKNRELPFSVVVSFEDADNNFVQRPLTFKDEGAILAEGQNLSEITVKETTRQYAAVGTVRLNEAVRVGWRLLNFGEFDAGGIRNRGRVVFRTTWLEAKAAALHPFKVIRVLSRKIQPRYSCEYFRVLSIKRLPDLQYEITAQEYNDAAYAELEQDELAPGTTVGTGGGVGDTGGYGGGVVIYPGDELPWDYPRGVGFSTVEPRADSILLRLSEV